MTAAIVNTKIDKAGRVVVPKALRDALRLRAGDELQISREGDSLTLRPAPSNGVMKRKNGMWVWSSPGSGVITNEMVNDLIEQGRREREERILGHDDLL